MEGSSSSPSVLQVPEWGEAEYVHVNSSVYEQLFWAATWDASSTMEVSARELREGRNDGVNNHGVPFVLQAMAVVQLEPSEAALSLTSEEYDQWVSGNVQVSIFAGFLITERWETPNAVPVTGFSYSSDTLLSSHIVIVGELDSSIASRFFDLWYYKSRLPPGMTDGSGEDWYYWLCDPGFPTPDPDCDKIIAECMDEYQSNMRIALATFKAVMATAGLGCIVGGVLTASFCLVGNLLACGVWGFMKWRCAVVLGAAAAALGTAMTAARIALDDCLGKCSGSALAPGCP